MKNVFLKMVVLSLILILFTGNDILTDWSLQNEGLPDYTCSAWAIDAADSMHMVMADVPYALYLTDNGGLNWKNIETDDVPATLKVMDISMPDVNNIWMAASYPPEIYHSSDQGKTWTLQYTFSDSVVAMNYIEMFDLLHGIAMRDASDQNEQALVFLRTVDGGNTWNEFVQDNMPAYSYNFWYPVDFIDVSTGYFYQNLGGSTAIWKTIDSCKTWTETVIESYSLYPVLKFYDKNVGVFAGKENMFTTRDGGLTWTELEKPYGTVAGLAFQPGNPDQFIISSREEILSTTDFGETLISELEDNTLNMFDMLITEDHSAWVLSCEGVYTNKYFEAKKITSIDISTHVNDFNLRHVYPNPFNPSTTIGFDLPAASPVNLQIYDILGRKVWEYSQRSLNAGSYDIIWDGTNKHNQQVAAGVYIIRMTAPEFSSQQKVVYLK